MAQTERLYKLKSIFDNRRAVSAASLRRELGVSRATLNRDLAHLRDRMNAPVVFDAAAGGYRLDRQLPAVGTQYELPGLWFSAEEIHALLTMQHLLSHLDSGGLLAPHIAPLTERLARALGSGRHDSTELARRIHVQTVGARRVHLPHFQAIGTGLLRRQRLQIAYHARGTDQASEREVSPQRLIHYRDNWYLDAWCHWRTALRSFAVDAIASAQLLATKAVDIADSELDEALGAGYGIFSGKAVEWATLRFSPERARWIAAETWHPQQRGHLDDQGRYTLELPYADPRELVMDILRHLPEVEVLAPESLRGMVEEKIRTAAGRLTG